MNCDTKKTNVIGYVRVSTDKQVESGLSIESQIMKIEQYVSLYDLELVEILIDRGVSASSLNRPELQRAFDKLESGVASALIVTKLDRLTRSVKDLGVLVEQYFTEKKGYSLLSVSDQIDTRTASGRLVLNILGSVSQWEREVIAERTSEALQAKKRRGEYAGGRVGFGYKIVDGKQVIDESKQAVIAMVKRLRGDSKSYRTIANELELAGHKNSNGKKFNKNVIARILKEVA